MNWLQRLMSQGIVRNMPDAATGAAGATPSQPAVTPAPGTTVPQPGAEGASALSAGTDDSQAGGTPAAGGEGGPGAKPPEATGESAKSALSEGDEAASDAVAESEAPAPLTIEALELGDDHGYDPETLGEFVGVMNDPELDAAGRAKAILGFADKLLVDTFTQVQKQAVDEWTAKQNEWRGQIRQLEGFGENTPQRLGEIKRGLMAAGADKETFAALDLTGAGNHPAIVKLLNTLAKPFIEKSIPSGGSVREGKTFEDRFSKLYPSTQNKG